MSSHGSHAVKPQLALACDVTSVLLIKYQVQTAAVT